MDEFAADPARRALDRFGPCLVAACPRDRHGGRRLLRTAPEPVDPRPPGRPRADEARWRRTTSVVVTGQVSLAGLPPTAQVLYGLQQRTRSGAHTRVQMLRMVVEDLRHAQADSVHATAPPPLEWGGEAHGAHRAGPPRRALALSDPETEKAKDVWELAVFGLAGRLTFTTISQPWLRQAAKRWATDELPRRRGDGAASVLRSLLAGVVRLSQSLRQPPTRPRRPPRPPRARRHRIVPAPDELPGLDRRDQPRVARQDLPRRQADPRPIRALGLTRPGGPAAGLGATSPSPAATSPPNPNAANPAATCCVDHGAAQLPVLERGPSGREIRVAVELLMDTGRRPAEILRLPLDCLTRDPDGAAVLIYDNHKRDRRERRLPISQATAAVITTQQQRVRERFPDTPLAELVLLPSPHANPTGAKSLSGGLLDLRHRDWVDQLPVLRRGRHRVRPNQDRALCLPAHLRPTPRRRRDRRRRAVPAPRSPHPRGHPPLLPGRGAATPRRRRHGDRAQLRPARQPALARRPRPAGLRARPLRRRRRRRPLRPLHRTVQRPSRRRGLLRFRCAGCDHFRTDVHTCPS